MNRALLAVAALALLAPFAGCGGGTGVARRTVAASGFTGVSVTAGIDVVISTSSSWSVELSADRLALDRIVVESRGSTLWIGLRPGTAARARWMASQAQVRITLPSLARMDVTDGSRARVDLAEPTVDLLLQLSRGSQLSGTISCAGLVITATGSSIVELTGSADRITLAGSDRAKLRLTGLETPSVDATLSSGSTAAVTASRRLVVEASGGSGLSFRGDARVERQILSGGAWVRRE